MEKQHLGRSIFNVLLSLLLVWGLSPVTAWADEEDTLTLDDEIENIIEEDAVTFNDETATAVDNNMVALNDKAENTAQGYTLMETELTSGWNQSGTCEWMIDDNGLLTVRPLGNGTEGVLGYWENYDGTPPWYSQRASIKTVKIEQGVKAQTCNNMFCGCESLTSLDLSGFDTSSVTNMHEMFGICSSLTSLDLSSFDTSSVTYMAFMFYGCSSLTSLDLSGFDSQNVTDMYWMFRNCSSLTSLDLSGFDTSSVTDMHRMFSGCSSLTSLDLLSFNTQNVTDIRYMFYDCPNLKSIYVSDTFVTTKVTSSSDMFGGCNSLVGGNGTKYSSRYTDKTYACIDTAETPGYFSVSCLPGEHQLSAPQLEISSEICEKGGTAYNVTYCETCNRELTREAVEITAGHVFVSLPEKEPTCAEVGYTSGFGCSRCGAILSGHTEIPKLAHTVAIDEAAPKTCTTSGLTQGSHCSVCNVVLVEQNVIPASHNPNPAVIENKIAGNCTTDEEYDSVVYCADCGEVVSTNHVVNKAPGHNYVTDAATEATCTTPAFSEGLHCDRCDQVFVAPQVTSPALGHDEVSSDEIPATCTETGLTAGTYCSRCGETITGREIIPLAEHNLQNGICSTCGNAATYYAVLYDTDSDDIGDKLVFQNTEDEKARYGTKVTSFSFSSTSEWRWDALAPWYSSANNITAVVFDCEIKPVSTAYWFFGMTKLTNINFSGLNTKNVTNMSSMFDSCKSLTSLDLSSFDTSNVENMSGMFQHCESLISLDLSNLNTANVKYMAAMFQKCSALEEADLLGWTFAEGVDMRQMFASCPKLISVPLGLTLPQGAQTSELFYVAETAQIRYGGTDESILGYDFASDNRTVIEGCAGEHDWDEGVVTLKASCTEPGLKTVSCKACGATRVDVAVPALGHHFDGLVCEDCDTHLGDVNGNGVVNIVDAQLAYDIATKNLYADCESARAYRTAADVTGPLGKPDGFIDANDAFAIQYVVHHGWNAA